MPFPKLAEIQKRMGENAATPAASESSAPAAAEAAPATESQSAAPDSGSSEPASSPESSSKAPAEAKADAPGPIPYDRFKQKNEEAKHLKELNGTLQERIKQLEAAQQAPKAEKEAKEPEPNPFMDKIKDLAEKSGDEDIADALIAMGNELESIRTQAQSAKQDTQHMQVQKLVDEYNRKISSALDGSAINDKAAGKHYILQVLNDNPDANIADAAKAFEEHERKLEDAVLERLGLSRPQAKEAAPAKNPAESLPHRTKTETGTASVTADTALVSKNKPMTLREMKSQLFGGRRRPR